MAYIVQQPGQKLNAEEIMEWVAKQVGYPYCFGYTVLSISCYPGQSPKMDIFSDYFHLI